MKQDVEIVPGQLRALPYWRSHKVVQADRVVRVSAPSEGMVLHLEGGAAVKVSDEWVHKHLPERGVFTDGWLVIYKDGYASWSPDQAFYEGYTQSDDPETEQEQGPRSFQQNAATIVEVVFGIDSVTDHAERNARFLEEALELVQARGLSVEQATALVAYVYNRAHGDAPREIGGVMVTLAALAQAAGLDMQVCGDDELIRLTQPEVIDACREKQAAKPRFDAVAPPPEGPVDPAGAEPEQQTEAAPEPGSPEATREVAGPSPQSDDEPLTDF